MAYYISRSLNNAPVSLTEFTYRDSAFFLENLSIKETSSRSDVLFRARGIALDVSIRELTRTPLVIESIEISDISLYIESYRNGSTNWDRLLSSPAKAETGKPYLIQELVLKNLYVEMRRPDGRLQRFPVIESLVLYNISNETGFPIHEVEKAIFRLVLRKIFEDFGINLMKNILPDPSILPFLQN